MQTVTDLITSADERILDADTLANAGRYEWAFYSAGYAVELVFKARIARILDFPDLFSPSFSDKELAKLYKVHNLIRLAKLSGLFNLIETQAQQDPQFSKSWLEVLKWSEQVRYAMTGNITEAECKSYIEDFKYITLWIKKHI